MINNTGYLFSDLPLREFNHTMKIALHPKMLVLFFPGDVPLVYCAWLTDKATHIRSKEKKYSFTALCWLYLFICVFIQAEISQVSLESVIV